MGDPPPLELLRWNLAERFGWTLAEVDALAVSDLFELLQIEDGRGKARAEMIKPKGRK
jgi:hypothetical protein